MNEGSFHVELHDYDQEHDYDKEHFDHEANANVRKHYEN